MLLDEVERICYNLYMTLNVGVKAFLRNKDGAYLILKRSRAKYKEPEFLWDIVGGRIDASTDLLDNLKREIKEETGLILSSEPKLIFAQDIIFGDVHVVRLTYIAPIDGEPILDTSENTEYKWLTVQELKVMPDIDLYAKEVVERGLL